MKKGLTVLATVLIAFTINPSFAASQSTGKIIVRIDDGALSRCINSSTDSLSLHLRRTIIEKQKKIFTEDKSVALTLNTVISGSNSSSAPQKVNFPRMYTAQLEGYSKGTVSVPVEIKLFEGFPLTDSTGNTFSSTEIEFSVMALKSKNKLGIALSTLVDITKNLPIPLNPFSEGFKYFSDYANKVVETSINEDNNLAAIAKQGNIALSFSSNGVCSGDQEQTGTIAVVTGENGKESDGIIDINKEYCWHAELRPMFNLYFQKRSTDGACSDDFGKYSRVNNPYFGFYLNAVNDPKRTKSNEITQLVRPPAQGIKRNLDIFSTGINKNLLSSYKLPIDTTAYVTEKVNSDLKMGANMWLETPVNSDGQATITSSVLDSIATDLSESLKRCAAHGIEASECI